MPADRSTATAATAAAAAAAVAAVAVLRSAGMLAHFSAARVEMSTQICVRLSETLNSIYGFQCAGVSVV